MSVEAGSVVLVRLGNARFWDDEERYLAGPGTDGSAACWAVERGILAVGADNMA